jgi:hypothetical protein
MRPYHTRESAVFLPIPHPGKRGFPPLNHTRESVVFLSPTTSGRARFPLPYLSQKELMI